MGAGPFSPYWICQNHGGFNLAFRDGPISSEKPVLLFGSDQLKAIPFVEADRPYGLRPGSYQHRTLLKPPQMRQQVRSNTAFLVTCADIGVPDQSHVLDRLNAHHTLQRFIFLVPPEGNTLFDFMMKLVPRHIGFGPAIFRDDTFVGERAIVDDGPDQVEVAVVTGTDHGCRPPGLAYVAPSGLGSSRYSPTDPIKTQFVPDPETLCQLSIRGGVLCSAAELRSGRTAEAAVAT